MGKYDGRKNKGSKIRPMVRLVHRMHSPGHLSMMSLDLDLRPLVVKASKDTRPVSASTPCAGSAPSAISACGESFPPEAGEDGLSGAHLWAFS